MKFLLYNIRYGTGTDWRFHLPLPFSGYLKRTGKRFPEILNVIKSYDPDVVALIEVDGGSMRSAYTNQAEALSRELTHYCVYHTKYDHSSFARWIPIMRKQGNAILAKKEIKSQKIHYFDEGVKRLIIEAEIEEIAFFTVHLSIRQQHRQSQLETLCQLIQHTHKPVIVSGDLNIFSGTKEIEWFLKQTGLKSANKEHMPTYPSKNPKWELDFILHSPAIVINNFFIPAIGLSDHLPLICNVTVTNRDTEEL